jgi:hypothetical protein
MSSLIHNEPAELSEEDDDQEPDGSVSGDEFPDHSLDEFEQSAVTFLDELYVSGAFDSVDSMQVIFFRHYFMLLHFSHVGGTCKRGTRHQSSNPHH